MIGTSSVNKILLLPRDLHAAGAALHQAQEVHGAHDAHDPGRGVRDGHAPHAAADELQDLGAGSRGSNNILTFLSSVWTATSVQATW